MPIEYIENHATILYEVLDRVLDKGIVVDAWIRVSPTGIDLVNDRLVVASIEIL